MARETRTLRGVKVEKRADGVRSVTGYASVFWNPNDPGTEYQLWPGLRERIMQGAFDRALREDDVRGLFNHDSNMVLGRVKAGTMRLTVDERGLRYDIDLPASPVGETVAAAIERGDVDGSSFGFYVLDEQYRDDGAGGEIREIRAVELFDVGPVTFPAYEATTAEGRSAGGVDRASIEAAIVRARAVRSEQYRVEAEARARWLRLKQLGMV